MAKRDYYDVLGVNKNASSDEDDKGKKDDNVVDADFEEVKDENKEKSA